MPKFKVFHAKSNENVSITNIKVVVAENLKTVTKHEVTWFLDSLDTNIVNEEILGNVTVLEDATAFTLSECSCVFLVSTKHKYYNTIEDFDNWSDVEKTKIKKIIEECILN
jgi:hypothetical protein